MWPVPKWSSSHRSASPDASLCWRAAFAASTRRHTSDNDASSINPPVAYYARPQTVRLVRRDQSTRGGRYHLFTGVRGRGVLRTSGVGGFSEVRRTPVLCLGTYL